MVEGEEWFRECGMIAEFVCTKRLETITSPASLRTVHKLHNLFLPTLVASVVCCPDPTPL